MRRASLSIAGRGSITHRGKARGASLPATQQPAELAATRCLKPSWNIVIILLLLLLAAAAVLAVATGLCKAATRHMGKGANFPMWFHVVCLTFP